MLPASEETLIRFCAHLADTLHHSSIKVYLSAVRSLHVDEGLPDPLVGCLQLRRVLRGIKRHQGSNQPKRQPITSDLMRVIHRSLDFSSHNHTMLWAACCIGFFGFLRAGEFTVNAPFDPAIHLSVNDIQADSLSNPKLQDPHKMLQDRPLSPRLLRLHRYWWARPMPRTCFSPIFAPSWPRSRPSFSSRRWHTSKPPVVGLLHSVHFFLCRSSGLFFRSQLPHWCGHLSSYSGNPRSPYQNPWPMVQQCLPALHSYAS